MIKEYKNNAGYIHEIKCSNCGHRETASVWHWPRRCYLCEEEDDMLSAKKGDITK
ncbi:MAG: hypothetical protein IKA94_01605 [Mogibacterium sp.]|nr:hypothetical protein [Mogibacterium sp.]